MSEYQPTYDFVAGVYRQALADAKRGDQDAIAWLDQMRPDWRELEQKRYEQVSNIQNKEYEQNDSQRFETKAKFENARTGIQT